MKRRAPTHDMNEGAAAFDRFREAVRTIVAVPKPEVQRAQKERHHPRKKQKDKTG
jgi:hypothetical protein